MTQIINCMNQKEFNNAITQISGNNPEFKEVKFFGLDGDINKINRLADAMKINTTLTSIDIGANVIGNTGAISIAEALKVNRALTTIELSDNGIGDAGAESIAEALKVNTTLNSINLHNSGIGEAGAASLAEALKVNRTLTSIEFSGYKIGDAGAASLAEALKVNTTLTGVALCYSHIGDAGAASLAEALKVNTTLTGIYLYVNDIGNAGAASIAEALKVNTTLTNINLVENLIDNEGAASLAEALKVNTTLTNINLAENLIDNEGAASLAEAIKVNRTLTSIKLETYEWEDVIDEEGASVLAKALQENHVITTFEIQETPEEISNIVKRNRQFLSQAVDASREGKTLTLNQQQTLMAHLSSDDVELFPINERKRFIESNEILFRDRMGNISQYNEFEHPAHHIVEFIGSIKDINNFNQRTSSRNKLQAVASIGDLGPALRLSNNRIFIDDALKNGMSSSQIKDNLNIIISDTKAHDYALENPKKLGYLITLDRVQLDRAIDIINHETLGKIVKENPEQIAKLVKDLSINWSNSSSNSEPLLSASHSRNNSPRESDAETNGPRKKPRSFRY